LRGFEETFLTFRIFSDGTVGYEENSRFWTRPVFETGATFSEQTSSANPWLPTENKLLATSNANSISVFDHTSGELIEHLQVEGYEVGFNFFRSCRRMSNGWPSLSMNPNIV